MRVSYFGRLLDEKISGWCRFNKKTVDVLCDEIGIDYHRMKEYRDGKEYPSETIMERLCSFFGCEIDFFEPPAIEKKEEINKFTTKELLAEIERRCGE